MMARVASNSRASGNKTRLTVQMPILFLCQAQNSKKEDTASPEFDSWSQPCSCFTSKQEVVRSSKFNAFDSLGALFLDFSGTWLWPLFLSFSFQEPHGASHWVVKTINEDLAANLRPTHWLSSFVCHPCTGPC